ncbi:MAG: DUF2993 domain-containing protein [Cyanobacteriota bacterium]|nr:DUF2993 domain-containing protein [Cyanobacteriota bacterium]
MLLINPQGLGEQALNKIAELAIASQFKEAQDLAVRVKTDPNLLAQGRLESLAIDGVGIVTQSNLRMQQMCISMGGIAVSPLKALMGNIELTEPSRGKASFILTEADLSRALNEKSIQNLTNRLALKLEERSVKIVPQSMKCHLSRREIAIAAQLQDIETKQVYSILLVTMPEMRSPTGIKLVSPHYKRGQEPSPQLTNLLLETLGDILNLRNFEMPGLSLQIQQFQLKEGQIDLQAMATMTHFPSNRS